MKGSTMNYDTIKEGSVISCRGTSNLGFWMKLMCELREYHLEAQGKDPERNEQEDLESIYGFRRDGVDAFRIVNVDKLVHQLAWSYVRVARNITGEVNHFKHMNEGRHPCYLTEEEWESVKAQRSSAGHAIH